MTEVRVAAKKRASKARKRGAEARLTALERLVARMRRAANGSIIAALEAEVFAPPDAPAPPRAPRRSAAKES